MGVPTRQYAEKKQSKPSPAARRSFQSGTLQAKLTIGKPNDMYEREADRLADRVMRMTDQATIQRKPGCPGCPEEEILQRGDVSGRTPQVTPGVESTIHSLNGGGHPLSPSTRSFFEPRFGTDFSHVRVHTGDRAAQTARAINAKAFTSGNNIVFNNGEFSPDNNRGKHLLAHELTHVIQQGASDNTGINRIQRTWKDSSGNNLGNYTQPRVWIMHSDDFESQAEFALENAVEEYGNQGGAISNPTTVNEFDNDWGNIRGTNVASVHLDFHGMNQSLNVLDSDDATQQITSTGTGKTNISGTPAKNVCDLQTPRGDISNAILYLNTCHSIDREREAHDGQGAIVHGTTLGDAFAQCFNFARVRGTAAGLNYVGWYHIGRDEETGTPYPENEEWIWIDRPPNELPAECIDEATNENNNGATNEDQDECLEYRRSIRPNIWPRLRAIRTSGPKKGNIYWTRIQIPPGTEVIIIQEYVRRIDWDGKTKTMTQFIYNGREYWLLSSHLE